MNFGNYAAWELRVCLHYERRPPFPFLHGSGNLCSLCEKEMITKTKNCVWKYHQFERRVIKILSIGVQMIIYGSSWDKTRKILMFNSNGYIWCNQNIKDKTSFCVFVEYGENFVFVVSWQSLSRCRHYKWWCHRGATHPMQCGAQYACLRCVYSESSLLGFHNDHTCSFSQCLQSIFPGQGQYIRNNSL